MLKKVMLIVTVFALMLAFGAVNVFADDTEEDPQCPGVYNADEDAWVYDYYCDGRLNAFDMMQSVAVYYAYTAEPVWNLVTTTDDDGEQVQTWEQGMTNAVSAIHIWSIDANGNGQLALYVPVDQIEPAFFLLPSHPLLKSPLLLGGRGDLGVYSPVQKPRARAKPDFRLWYDYSQEERRAYHETPRLDLADRHDRESGRAGWRARECRLPAGF